jgi:hypothetical protein
MCESNFCAKRAVPQGVFRYPSADVSSPMRFWFSIEADHAHRRDPLTGWREHCCH